MAYTLVTLLTLFVSVYCLPAGNITNRNDIGDTFSSAKAVLAQLPNQAIEIIRRKPVVVPTLRPFGREEAKHEHESPLSKPESVYGKAHQFVSNIIHPKPIVDTISESDKYGNTGDQFRKLNNLVVNGYEGFSNFLNAAVDIPFETMKQITRKASAFLGDLGAKIVGL